MLNNTDLTCILHVCGAHLNDPFYPAPPKAFKTMNKVIHELPARRRKWTQICTWIDSADRKAQNCMNSADRNSAHALKDAPFFFLNARQESLMENDSLWFESLGSDTKITRIFESLIHSDSVVSCRWLVSSLSFIFFQKVFFITFITTIIAKKKSFSLL